MPADFSPPARKLLDFYRGEGRTDRGYTFPMVLDWDDDTWEDVHDFIQWVFPNARESAFNPDAPTLTPELIALWASDPVLAENLGLAFDRWLRFVGVERDGAGGFRFEDPTNLGVWDGPNHNWLRITRVLTCLRLLHRKDDAKALSDFLLTVAAPRFDILEDTLRFWRDAAELR